MSILGHLQDCCKAGVLHPIDPLLPSIPCVRGLFVSTEIYQMLSGSVGQEIPWSLARAIMDTYVSGDVFAVSQGKAFRKDAPMGHLDPLEEGVWTMKPSKPKPGIRIFGQFAAKDIFVAVDWRERILLEDHNSMAWRSAIRTCKARCNSIFNPYSPITGSDANDYVSNIFLI